MTGAGEPISGEAGPAAPVVSGGAIRIEDRVRWSDVDAAGIICYGAYLRFYEIAETELFRAAGEPFHEIFERYDVWLPRVHIESDFFRPAFLDDLLRVQAAVERIGRTSLHLAFRVERDGAEIARARFVMVCVRRGDLAKTPLPPALVAALERFRSIQSSEPASPQGTASSSVRESLGSKGGGRGGPGGDPGEHLNADR